MGISGSKTILPRTLFSIHPSPNLPKITSRTVTLPAARSRTLSVPIRRPACRRYQHGGRGALDSLVFFGLFQNSTVGEGTDNTQGATCEFRFPPLNPSVPHVGWWPFNSRLTNPHPAPNGPSEWIATRQGFASDRWRKLSSFPKGRRVAPPIYNGHVYIALQSGATGSKPPLFPTSVGETVVDGTITWKEDGPAAEFHHWLEPSRLGYGDPHRLALYHELRRWSHYN